MCMNMAALLIKSVIQYVQGMKMLLASGVNVFIEVGFDMEVAYCV